MRWSDPDNEVMKRPLLASMAAVLVSSALLVSPAAAAGTSTSEAVVLPAGTQLQIQPSNKSGGGVSTMGVNEGSKIFWCSWWGYFC
jgi:hypothetical protein